MSSVLLYHGLTNPSGLTEIRRDLPNDPQCIGRKNMDFGAGFYLTPSAIQAMEWSVRNGTDGSINYYLLKLDNLKILNLDPKETSLLYGVGEIIDNRKFIWISSLAYDWIYDWIKKNWCIGKQKYDIILGYTADDQCFSIYKDFFNNQLSFKGLCKAILLGGLGYQYVIKSEKGYNNLIKFKNSETIACFTFGPLTENRRNLAKYHYSLIRKEHSDPKTDELFFSIY